MNDDRMDGTNFFIGVGSAIVFLIVCFLITLFAFSL